MVDDATQCADAAGRAARVDAAMVLASTLGATLVVIVTFPYDWISRL